MAAPVPSWWQSTTAAATTTLTPTCNVGDLLVVVQESSSAGASSPVAPTSGSGGSWSGGARTSGTDAFSTSGSTEGKVQIWSKIAASGDSGAAVTVSTTGIATGHRFQLIVIPGNWTSGRVAQIVDDSTTNNSIANYGIANTGSTAALITDTSRGAIVIATFAAVAATAGLTITYDGATSGSKFQREPFSNEGSTTDSTIDHTHHYSTNSSLVQTDFQEYDSSDTLVSVLYNSGMGNTTHAVAVVVYQVANVITVGVVTETDAAQPIVASKTKAIGTASEVDTAQHISKVQGFHFANQVTETDAAQPIVASKKRAIGTATETDTAQGGFHAHRITLGTKIETDAAQPIVPLKSHHVDPPVTIDDPTVNQKIVGIQVTARKNYPLDAGDIRIALYQNGVPYQVSGWSALTNTNTLYTLTLTTPIGGTGFALWWEVRYYGSLDLVIEDANTGALTVNYVGTALETDTAQAVGHKPFFPARVAPETDTAQPIGKLKRFTLGTALEHDTARPITVVAALHSTPLVGTLRQRSRGTFNFKSKGTLRQKSRGTLEP